MKTINKTAYIHTKTLINPSDGGARNAQRYVSTEPLISHYNNIDGDAIENGTLSYLLGPEQLEQSIVGPFDSVDDAESALQKMLADTINTKITIELNDDFDYVAGYRTVDKDLLDAYVSAVKNAGDLETLCTNLNDLTKLLSIVDVDWIDDYIDVDNLQTFSDNEYTSTAYSYDDNFYLIHEMEWSLSERDDIEVAA